MTIKIIKKITIFIANINKRLTLSLSLLSIQLTIQFNDSATKTFEYPSEASLLLPDVWVQRQSNESNGNNGFNSTSNETNNSVISSESSLRSLKGNLALGGVK